jgi:hypothetical protein
MLETEYFEISGNKIYQIMCRLLRVCGIFYLFCDRKLQRVVEKTRGRLEELLYGRTCLRTIK